MEMEEVLDITEMDNVENTCYECGTPCIGEVHFCNEECSVKFRSRFTSEQEMLNSLGKITSRRKKLGHPHHKK